MQDLVVALALSFVLEGMFYALAPEKAQSYMREIIQMSPDALRKAGLLVAAIGVAFILMIKG